MIMVRMSEFAPDLVERFGYAPPLVEIHRQGNFTLSFLFDEDGEMVSFGVAKRSVKDREQPGNAARLATARALKRYAK
jgi:hypothetical protein